MIRLGQHIRLTRREIERFKKITDLEPVGIRSLSDLAAYIERCKVHYAVLALADRPRVPAVP